MRKQIIEPARQLVSPAKQNWLDLEQLVQIELTSEEEGHPIESAFTMNESEGWRAAQSAKQTIRLVFVEPQNIKQIKLLFREKEQERTQEFLLRWLSADDLSYQEIVRQQYSFSPPHTIQQLENYTVNLFGMKALELTINPDISRSGACASLAQLRLGGWLE
jgi:hypothetical protein